MSMIMKTTTENVCSIRFLSVVVLCTVLPLLCFNAHAVTYYVDAANGNDVSDGLSTQTAWQTVNRVNRQPFQPGDEILFRRGEVWYDTLEVRSSGTGNLPVRFGMGRIPVHR